jgi:hypothetical protein
MELVDVIDEERKWEDLVWLIIDLRLQMAKGQETQETPLDMCSWRRSIRSEESG